MLFVNLSKREKNLFYVTVAAILISLMYNFAFKPLAAKWDRLNSQILQKEIILKKNIRYLQQADKVNKAYLKYAGYIKGQGLAEEEMSLFLNQVERQARASQVHIANIKPKPILERSFYNKYALEIHCQASLKRFIEFIYALQSSSQLIRVEKLQLNSQGKDTPLKAQMLITKILSNQ